MRLVTFSVEKYRSITRAWKITLGDKAILVGPNNEGKSNILRALVTAMNILTRGRRPFVRRNVRAFRFISRRFYNWNTDFPMHLQERMPNGESVMILEFELTDNELSDFRKIIKSRLTGTLPLRIAISPDSTKVSVYKKGPGSVTLTKKSVQIASFVSERLDFEHIPAVRTAKSAQRIVDDLVDWELTDVEEDKDFIEALRKVAEIQQPILDKLSESIKKTLVKFLPKVSDVKVQIPSEARYRALRRSCQIVIDDGTATLLKYKGDGVQSLAALGIMQHASESGSRGKNFVIAIEEPESHLHPNAIHELRDVISELSKKHQIVLTTHCPLFVDRAYISSNIIVHKNKARAAKKIQEIREILGVRASDNLRNAEIVLLVEGEDDIIALKSVLRFESKRLKTAIDNGTIAIDSLGGGTNLAYKIGLIRDALCLAHCFLDDDKCGHESYNKARIQGLIADADVNFSICEGMQEAEIEDLYDPSIYTDLVKNLYRITLESPKFKSKKKWSERMRDVFRQQGKRWNGQVEMELKKRIAEAIANQPKDVLNENKRSAIDGLIISLEERLDELNKSR